MSKRYAILYDDGSLNVSTEGEDFKKAQQMLSATDDETMVEVEITIIKTIGNPKLKLVQDNSCPHCGEPIT